MLMRLLQFNYYSLNSLVLSEWERRIWIWPGPNNKYMKYLQTLGLNSKETCSRLFSSDPRSSMEPYWTKSAAIPLRKQYIRCVGDQQLEFEYNLYFLINNLMLIFILLLFLILLSIFRSFFQALWIFYIVIFQSFQNGIRNFLFVRYLCLLQNWGQSF